jgi:hypothetical protein
MTFIIMAVDAECCYADCYLCCVAFMLSVESKLYTLSVIMLSVIMLSVVMLSVIMMSVIMLSVIILSVVAP